MYELSACSAPAYRVPSIGAYGMPAACGILRRPPARELRELVRRQHLARGLEHARLVERVVVRPTSLAEEALDRIGDAGDRRRRSREVGARVRPEVVLAEVVRQDQAVVEEARRDDALRRLVAVEGVVEAADRVADARQALVLRGLAGVDQLAAVIEVVPHPQREVLLALGDPDVGELPAPDADELVLRVLRDPVVPEVPQHRVVVVEHAEVVRHAAAVDVPDVGAVAGLADRPPVGPHVLGRVGARRVGRVDARVVLVGDDQDVVAAVAGDAGTRSSRSGPRPCPSCGPRTTP